MHVLVISDLFMVDGSWLMAQGSWLMPQGSWLMAHGQEKFGAIFHFLTFEILRFPCLSENDINNNNSTVLINQCKPIIN